MGEGQRIEIALDGAAAAWLGGSSGAALFLAGGRLGILDQPPLISAAALAVTLATYRAFAALRQSPHPLPAFDLRPIKSAEPDLPSDELLLTVGMAVLHDELLLTGDMTLLPSELLLTRGQMLDPPDAGGPDSLLLDDVLTQVQPDSRVVQLFDPAKLPTAGELQSRIDRHLSRVGRVAPDERLPDSSQALYDALADLRRSLA